MQNLRFRLEGSKEAGGEVAARDFAQFLDALLKCLNLLEKETKAQAGVHYRIAGLETGSAVIEVRPSSPGDVDKSAAAVADTFEAGFRALEEGRIRAAPFGRKTKAAFVQLLRPLNHETRSIEFVGRERHGIVRGVAIPEIPTPKIEATATGSVAGHIEALNVHSRFVFYLYPESGAQRIPCAFDPAMLDEVRKAIKRHARVVGAIEYEPGNPFPVRVVVEGIEVTPPPEALPTLASLTGLLGEIPGGRSSVGHVRHLRDAEA